MSRAQCIYVEGVEDEAEGEVRESKLVRENRMVEEINGKPVVFSASKEESKEASVEVKRDDMSSW